MTRDSRNRSSEGFDNSADTSDLMQELKDWNDHGKIAAEKERTEREVEDHRARIRQRFDSALDAIGAMNSPASNESPTEFDEVSRRLIEMCAAIREIGWSADFQRLLKAKSYYKSAGLTKTDIKTRDIAKKVYLIASAPLSTVKQLNEALSLAICGDEWTKGGIVGSLRLLVQQLEDRVLTERNDIPILIQRGVPREEFYRDEPVTQREAKQIAADWFEANREAEEERKLLERDPIESLSVAVTKFNSKITLVLNNSSPNGASPLAGWDQGLIKPDDPAVDKIVECLSACVRVLDSVDQGVIRTFKGDSNSMSDFAAGVTAIESAIADPGSVFRVVSQIFAIQSAIEVQRVLRGVSQSFIRIRELRIENQRLLHSIEQAVKTPSPPPIVDIAPPGRPGRHPDPEKEKHAARANELRKTNPQTVWKQCALLINREFEITSVDQYTDDSIRDLWRLKFGDKKKRE